MDDQNGALFPAMVNKLSELPPNSQFGKWFENNLPVMEEKLGVVESQYG